MKSLVESIRLNENVNKSYRNILDKPIVFSEMMRGFFSTLNLDFRHIYDQFVVKETGEVVYTNPKLFDGEIKGKVYKNYLNRTLRPNSKYFTITKTAEGDCIKCPRNYLIAVLNELTMGNYVLTNCVTLSNLIYTKGDLEKDMSC